MLSASSLRKKGTAFGLCPFLAFWGMGGRKGAGLHPGGRGANGDAVRHRWRLFQLFFGVSGIASPLLHFGKFMVYSQ